MGHFEQGKWVTGISRDLIGKKIIRNRPCRIPTQCGGYLDYSYCKNGIYGYQPDEWVILHGIEDGCLLIEWMPSLYPGDITKQDPCWNDDYWEEVKDV